MSRKNGEQGTSRPAWHEAGLAHVWLPYAQMKTVRAPLAVARTHGCRIVLCDGRELMDGIASWWTACHGYNHPHIRKAVEDQLALMPHVMFGGLVHEQALTLARRLAALLPGDLSRVFFSESGSVAVEIAMKMAVQFWVNQGVPKRKRFVTFRGGYHGDTTGATIARDKVFEAFWSDEPSAALPHGPTFMANALACAAANASLDLFEREPRLRQVADIALALERGLAPCRGRPGVKDVRVKGAIGVVELDRIDDLEGLRARFVEEGVFVRPFGSIVYLTPAFTISAGSLRD